MKTEITLKLETELVQDLELLAARRDTSVSQLVSEALERWVRRELAYDAAQRRAMERLKRGYRLEWSRTRDRGELYER